MTSHRASRLSSPFPWRSALVAALVVSLLVGLPAFTDDTNLLRFDTAKPYVFIILDTSASMGLEFDTTEDSWTPAGADGPGSRMYQAKQALFNTFRDVNDVHFGFASFNQDLVRAYQKHWIYYHEGSLPNSWPLEFPLPDTDTTADDADSSALTKLIAIPEVDADGNVVVSTDEDGNVIPPEMDTRILELEGHVLTFGASYGSEGREAGSCDDPLNYTDAGDLRRMQSFAIDGQTAPTPTRMWLTNGGNGGNAENYLLQVSRPGNRDDGTVNSAVSQDKMQIKLELFEVSGCPFIPGANADHQMNLRFFLDPHLSETFVVDSTSGAINDGSNNQGIEPLAGLWEQQDAVSEADFGSRPFTGEGWESNYDGGGLVVIPTGASDAVQAKLESLQDSLDAEARDRWCADLVGFVDGVFDDSLCPNALTSEVKPAVDTVFDSQDRRSLDYGDMIPFHWSIDRRTQFLHRLAPGYASVAEPDFRGASFFEDEASGVAGLLAEDDPPLQLKNSSRRPLLALDNSPLARAINDMRCWYLGSRGKGTNKCKAANPLVDIGWEETACEYDSQFGCRKPYMIIISDGGANTGGENPVADVSDLQTASGIRTWVLNLGEAKNCQSGTLSAIVNASGKGKGSTGECINVDGGDTLRQELESILGQIRTEVRAFASAAVPTVQATVEQKIFLTNFIPFNDSGTWDGHVDAFLKPLPVDEVTGKPDETKVCGDTYTDAAGETRVRTTRCFLWDAGDNLLALQYDDTADTEDLLGLTDTDRRRVFYARQAAEPGQWVNGRELFLEPTLELATQEQRFDLWEGLGISGYDTDELDGLGDFDPTVNDSQHSLAEDVVDHVLRKKVGTELNTAAGTSTKLDVLLGDIFHSTPQVIGTPPNLFYFSKDLNGDDSVECEAGDDNENKGYRCFFNRNRLRRKMLVVGANDGQFHAFEAGRFRGHDDPDAEDYFTGLELVNDANLDGSFDNGTGLELFSYVPRMVMPLLNEQQTTTSKHKFSVDGNVTVSDVFIDPVADGGTFPTAADREWRTVAIGGLREGGIGYYALDITQPDPIETHPELGFVPTVASGGDSNNPASANYLPGCLDAATPGCGTLPFPAVTWEFTDRFYEGGEWYWYDEDREWMEDSDSGFAGVIDDNDPSFGQSDLGDSWSTPNIGRIQVCTLNGSDCAPGGDDVEDRYVAIFGGGMDVESKASPLDEVRGNWLYMVDIETGQAIYKQRLQGAAPAEPAAVDLNGDGYFDRIYLGTLAGYLYRVDLGLVSGDIPALEEIDVAGVSVEDGSTLETTAVRLPRDVWQPAVLFNANFDIGFNNDGSPVTDDDGNVLDQDSGNFRPIFYRPAIIFQADEEGFVVAFGTGDREDLWSLDPVTGRFFMLVDNFASTSDIFDPLDESDLARVDADLSSTLGATDLLDTGGWYLVLGEKERVITEAFSLSGLTIFSAYEPIVYTGDDSTDGQDVGDGEGGAPEESVCGDDIEAVGDNTVCSLRGNSNIYVVKTTNGDGLLFDTNGNSRRSKQVADFVTNPFTEQGTVKRAEGDGSDAEGDDGGSADRLTEDLKKVMESLKELFPAQCRFANYRVDVKTIAADTSLQFIAPVPVCIIEHNWKEF